MSRHDAWSPQKLAPAPLDESLGPMSSHWPAGSSGGGGLGLGALGDLPGRGDLGDLPGLGELIGPGAMFGLGTAGGGGRPGAEGSTQLLGGLGSLKIHRHLHHRQTAVCVLGIRALVVMGRGIMSLRQGAIQLQAVAIFHPTCTHSL